MWKRKCTSRLLGLTAAAIPGPNSRQIVPTPPGTTRAHSLTRAAFLLLSGLFSAPGPSTAVWDSSGRPLHALMGTKAIRYLPAPQKPPGLRHSPHPPLRAPRSRWTLPGEWVNTVLRPHRGASLSCKVGECGYGGSTVLSGGSRPPKAADCDSTLTDTQAHPQGLPPPRTLRPVHRTERWSLPAGDREGRVVAGGPGSLPSWG